MAQNSPGSQRGLQKHGCAKGLGFWWFNSLRNRNSGLGDNPSYLSRELNTDPTACVEVTNLGVEGYVTNQEVILLSQQLKAGRKPDIAIFYDGINESLVGGFSPGISTAHWNFDMIKNRVEMAPDSKLVVLNSSHVFQFIKSLLENYRQKRLPAFSDGELTAKAQATLENYETNLRFMHLLANAYGFKTYFFWQPALACGTKPLTLFEQVKGGSQ